MPLTKAWPKAEASRIPSYDDPGVWGGLGLLIKRSPAAAYLSSLARGPAQEMGYGWKLFDTRNNVAKVYTAAFFKRYESDSSEIIESWEQGELIADLEIV